METRIKSKCYVILMTFFTLVSSQKKDMDALNIIYWLKKAFGPPYRYLGANVEKVQLKDGQFIWSINCVDYLKSAIDNADIHLE